MMREWLPFVGERKVLEKFAELQGKHFAVPTALGISASKIVESVVMWTLGPGGFESVYAWVVSFGIFLTLYIVFHEWGLRKEMKEEAGID